MAKATIKVTGLKKLARTMKKVEANMPEIRAQTLNNMAFNTFTLTRMDGGTIDRNFDLRNKFTQGSVRFAKAAKRPGSVSIVGSVQEYLAVQEFGEDKHDVGHIPTDDARMQKNRGKRVSGKQKLSNKNFNEAGPLVIGNRAAFIKIRQRQRANSKRPMRLRINGKHGTQEGLYRLVGRGGTTLRMIHNVSKEKVKIKKKPWLRPAAIISAEKGLKFFVRNFNRKLRKG